MIAGARVCERIVSASSGRVSHFVTGRAYACPMLRLTLHAGGRGPEGSTAMVRQSLDALRSVQPAPTWRAVLAAVAVRLGTVLGQWLDGIEGIPGDMEGTLLLFYLEQGEAAALDRIQP